MPIRRVLVATETESYKVLPVRGASDLHISPAGSKACFQNKLANANPGSSGPNST